MKSALQVKTALILIDVQNGFLHPEHWGTSRSTPQCESNIAKLLQATREFNRTRNGVEETLVCHVHHHSLIPSSLLHPSAVLSVDGRDLRAVEPQPFAAPLEGESVWVKDVNSAFIGTGLEAHLRQHDVRQLIICGLTTDHCVSTSTRMAGNLRIVDKVTSDAKTSVVEKGDIVLVGDACATYAKGGFEAEIVHQVSLASLDGEFADVAKTETVTMEVFGISQS